MMVELRTFCGLCGLTADWDSAIPGPCEPSSGGGKPLHSRPRMPTAASRRQGADASLPGWACGPPFPRPAAVGWSRLWGSGQESVAGSRRPHVTSLLRAVGPEPGAGERRVAVIPTCSSAVRPQVTYATVADQQVATMSLSRSRVVRALATEPWSWEAAVPNWPACTSASTSGAQSSCPPPVQLSSGTYADMWSAVAAERGLP